MLANALKKNKSLRELHMKGNELGNEGVKAICTALLERQSPITSLDFGNNRCSMNKPSLILHKSTFAKLLLLTQAHVLQRACHEDPRSGPVMTFICCLRSNY